MCNATCGLSASPSAGHLSMETTFFFLGFLRSLCKVSLSQSPLLTKTLQRSIGTGLSGLGLAQEANVRKEEMFHLILVGRS